LRKIFAKNFFFAKVFVFATGGCYLKKSFVFGGMLREQKNICKSMCEIENFRENHPGNKNFHVHEIFAKTKNLVKSFAKSFAKAKIFAKRNIAKSERISAYFRENEKGVFVSTLPPSLLSECLISVLCF
jgi:hypothetical protein